MVNFFISLLIFFFFDQSKSDEKSEELEINANQFTHDKENKRIFATGKVEIFDKQFKIFADKVFINTEKKIISAKDNVKIFYSDGSIIKTDSLVADENLENAKLSETYLYMPNTEAEELLNDDVKRFSRVAAMSSERRSNTWEVFRNAVFTACDICFNKKKRSLMNHLCK